MILTDAEKAILNAIRDPDYVGYEPQWFSHYPPLLLVELADRSGLSMEIVSTTVDGMVQKGILGTQMRPFEFVVEGEKPKPIDFHCIGYRICDNDIAEEACSQLGE